MGLQTDTGPILFPDLSADCDSWIDKLLPGLCRVHNDDWAEFILQVPTPLNESVSVNHYSRAVQMKTRNSIYRVSA